MKELSVKELRRAATILDRDFRGHRVERWVQPDATSLAVALYGRDSKTDEGRKRNFKFSCRGNLARIGAIDRLPKAPERPPAFSSYLRAHLSRAVLQGARLMDDDRQLALRFTAREGEFELLLSVFGNRSNLYVLGPEGEILSTLRPLSDVRPELKMGIPYRGPEGGGRGEGDDRFDEAPDADYFDLIEGEFGPREEGQDGDEVALELGRVLRREVKNAGRRLEKIEAELAEADLAGEYAKHGELLKGALGRISPGDTEIRLADYETGDEVVVSLDPKKSPKANLEATFKKYQKLLRRLTKAGGQEGDARAWLSEVEGLAERVSGLREAGGAAGDDMKAIAALPQIRRLLKKKSNAGQAPALEEEKSNLPARLRDIPTRLVPRRYTSKDGLEIWVGRSDEGNDYLTTRLARGKDLFFHVDGFPGSHVVLRTEGRDDPPADSLIDACELAVHFSKQRNAGSAHVHAVPIKNVKKPKGAKKGLVHVTGGKSIHLRREAERLERVMAARID
jgi:predicted ribosome quality control (RQC) complex YloA/Tae2 family protein